MLWFGLPCCYSRRPAISMSDMRRRLLELLVASLCAALVIWLVLGGIFAQGLLGDVGPVLLVALFPIALLIILLPVLDGRFHFHFRDYDYDDFVEDAVSRGDLERLARVKSEATLWHRSDRIRA